MSGLKVDTRFLDLSAYYTALQTDALLAAVVGGSSLTNYYTKTQTDALLVTKQAALSGTGIVKSTAGTISYLTDNSTNWDSAYTNRITSLTVTGSSGAATLVSNVLNIPTYTLSGLGGQPLESKLTSLSSLGNVTTGLLKYTSGVASYDTSTYLTGNQTITLSGDITGSGATTISTTVTKINGTSLAGLSTGLLKNTISTGVPSIAVAGTDYIAGGVGTTDYIPKFSGSGVLGNSLIYENGQSLDNNGIFRVMSGNYSVVSSGKGLELTYYSPDDYASVLSYHRGVGYKPIHLQGSVIRFVNSGVIKGTFTDNGLLINTTTDAGYQFDVNGTGRFVGALTLSTALTVPNGGTGLTSLTAGYIPFGNGTGSLSSNSNLFWDNSNQRLGINVTPTYNFNLQGTTGATVGKIRKTTAGGDNLVLDVVNSATVTNWLKFTTDNETYTYGNVVTDNYALSIGAQFNIQLMPGSVGGSSGAGVNIGANQYAVDIGHKLGVWITTAAQKGLRIYGTTSQTGNLFEVLNSSQITLSYFNNIGALNIGATTASTSTTTGALIVSGGLGVGGALYGTTGNFSSTLIASNLSGTNTGDQTITLTGAVTGSGTGLFTTTLASSIVGISNLSATGTPDSTTFLRGDNTWATPAGGSGITIGTTAITSGTSGRILYNNSSVVGELSTTGTGNVVLATSPTFSTSIFSPLLIGGTGTTSPLTFRSTSGVGTTGADIIFQTGNNGGTEVMRLLNDGKLGIATTSVSALVQIGSGTGDSTHTVDIFTPAGASQNNVSLIRTNNSQNNFIQLQPDGANSSSNVNWLFGMAGGTNNFSFSSWDGGSVTEYMSITNTGNTGFNITSPTAAVHIKAGTTTVPSLKIDSGTLVSTISGSVNDGALEYASSHLYFTIGSTRYQLDQQGGSLSDGDKGDITVSSSGSVWTIDNSVVTLAKMADIATASILGRNTGGTGVPEVLSASTAKTLLSLNNVENTALSTWAGTGNITTLGTITTGTWSGTTIAVNKGGTNLTSYAVGDLIYASASTTLSKLAAVASGQFLKSAGVTTAPVWGTISESDLPNQAGISWTTYSDTITWNGTAPSGTAFHEYKYYRIGKMVFGFIRIRHNTAGANNTTLTLKTNSFPPISIPSDASTYTDYITSCTGYLDTADSGSPPATRCWIEFANETSNFVIKFIAGTQSAKFAMCSFTYLTA